MGTTAGINPALAGRVYPPSPPYEVGREKIREFAEAINSWDPLHRDPEAARAKGLPERTVLVKHALRNALIPVLTVTSLQVGFLLVGSVLVETTLGLGGLGSLITDAIQNRDYPVIQATVLLLTVAFSLLNLATDLLYGAIDPRIRYG